jgi:tetratricopeptide (TPR) repeat protein
MRKEWKILILISLCLLLTACHKSPPKATPPLPTPPPMTIPAPPPPPNKLEVGEQKFLAGNYPEAAKLLEAYLVENPNAADTDKATFRLGIAYALIGKTPQDMALAQSRLRVLVNQFPQSIYKPQAELILTLQSDLEQLRRNIQDRDKSILILDQRLRSENRRVAEREAGIRDREEKIKERDEKIRKLTQELDQMKKIDLERRPSLPPQ